MAGELVGGAVLSAFLQVAFDRLASPAVMDYFRGNRLSNKVVDKLKHSLLFINAIMDDAEQKQFSNRHVRSWLDMVKDVVLDAEDLLDEIHTEGSMCNLQPANTSKVCNYFSTPVASSFDRELESRMNEILDNLESLKSEKEILGLKEGIGMGKKAAQRLPTTSLVDEAAVYGRDDDKKIIIDLLLSENGRGNNLSVISIVGMGGLGKTTLAQLVYNDHRMKDEFNLKAWVFVSEEFDVVKVIRTVLEAITKSTDNTNDLNELQVKLKEKLTGKKFFLVFDDVWNENYLNWEALRAPLIYGARGSKILVTTRSEKVASTMRCTNLHQLKQLPEEESWSLFAKHALHDENPHSDSGFEEIGRKIIEKCKGLPLALKTIGSLLYSKQSYEEWNGILESEIWELSDEGSNIIPALILSYQDLESHHKRCFAYCSLFPKGYKFNKDHLVHLWMAENFLQSPQLSKSMKELGDQCFNHLLSRSFFQRLDGEGKRFVMHDLISDLAKYVSGEFCLRLEKDEEANNASKVTRHFSYLIDPCEVSKLFDVICKCDKLRTWLRPEEYLRFLFTDKTIHDLCSKFKRLRVLSMSHSLVIYELPDSIVNLKHLRYLDLSGTLVKKLPNSICLLYHLQTLKLRYCSYLEELPTDLYKLINLCHLDFRGTKVRKVPSGLEKLKNLEVFCSFYYLGKGGGSNMKQLAELNIRDELHIKGLQNVTHCQDALAADLKNKVHLEGLRLEWSKNDDISPNEKDVLEMLQPHKNLKWLHIKNYGGIQFPNWFGDNSLSNIVFIQLINCKYCFVLPSLGILPSLKELQIEGLDRLVFMGPEFFGDNSCTAPFGSLEVLKIKGMAELKEWECQNAPGAFPRLQELCIKDCPKLQSQLPEQLPSLLKLEIINCKQLVASFPWMPAIEDVRLKACENLKWESPPSTLKSFRVDDSPNVECPISHSHAFIETVDITNSCDSLRTFPLGFFPKLTWLELCGCINLERLSISEEHDLNLNSLIRLGINGCPKIVSLPEDMHIVFPSLRKISLHDCPELESFPEGGLPSNLRELRIHNWPKLVSFSKGFSAPKLKECLILQMESLKSLPEDMHIVFPSLLTISLRDCPELESFPEGGLPSNLKDLGIMDCPKLMASRMEWNLDRYTSLVRLFIRDANMESFPDQGLLPPTLTFLELWRCSNLQTLNYNGLCHLSSLGYLRVGDCPRLQCLPKEGLPSSLSIFEIWGDCPLLKQRCQKQSGEDWSKIAHIKYVKINADIIT